MMSEFKDNKSKEEGAGDLPLSLSAAVEPFVVAEGLPFFGGDFDFVPVLVAEEVLVVAVASTPQPSRLIIAAIFFPRNVALVPQI